LITARDVILLSSIDWDFPWQGHQEVATRLARAGNRVLYVETVGVRSPRRGDGRRVASRLAGWLRGLGHGGVREVRPNLYVRSPLVLPPFGSRRRRAVNRRLLSLQIGGTARRLGMRDPILWTFLPTDTAVEAIELLRAPGSVVVYSCLADFGELASHRERLREAERELLRRCDLVFAQGSTLAAHCARCSSRVHRVDCAVALDNFPTGDGGVPQAGAGVRASRANGGAPGLASLPRPIIGYVGGLHRHLELGLAVEMARARPEWSWVYVGPAQVPVEELAAIPNVSLVGDVPHSGLASYIESFDACVVPYRLDDSTETVFPTKILEYLAMGKPVVTTALPELDDFNRQHGVLITAEARSADFLEGIEDALGGGGEELRAARLRAAATRDWTAQLERMSALIEAAEPINREDGAGGRRRRE